MCNQPSHEPTIHGSIKAGIVFKNVQFNRDIRGERLARTRQCNNGGHCIVGTAGRGAITAWTMAAPPRVPSSMASHALLSLSLSVSLTHSLVYSLTHSFARSLCLTCSLTRFLCLTRSLARSLSLSHSLARSLSLSHSLAHSFTLFVSLTRSLALPRRDSLIKKETIFQFSIRFTVSHFPSPSPS